MASLVFRVGVARDATLLVFLVTGAFIYFRNVPVGGQGLLRLIFEPTIAALVFVVSSSLVPKIVGSRIVRWPHLITLPVYFGSIFAAVRMMIEGPRPSLRPLDEGVRVDALYGEPLFVGAVLLLLSLWLGIQLLWQARRWRRVFRPRSDSPG
ncbi:MAG TPA: hypothetical protein PLO61_10620 [Fimbriimonadaceae bacterium]|nr:hypothetical protein [Fimbriimonadaceae bacterium]HRJ34216.1 hypothetical protein [Fimbriimonadaceae bacterium]